MTRLQHRKPGRVRRWVVRPAVWILLLPLVLLTAAVLYLKSPSAAERLRVLVRTQISQALDRPVEIGAARLDLLLPGVELRQLTIAGATAADPPFLTADVAGVELGVRGLFSRQVRLERVWVERLIVELTIGEDGRLDLPTLQGGGGDSELEIEMGELVVNGGEARFRDLRLPLSIDAREVRATMHGAGGDWALAGHVGVEQVELRLPDAEPYRIATSFSLALDPLRQLEIRSGRLRGAGETADLQGVVQWANADGQSIDPEVHVTVEARGDADLASRLGYLDGEVAGAYSFNGRFDWAAGAWVVSGVARAPSLRLLDERADDVVANLRVDEREVRLEIDQASWNGGTVTGDVLVELVSERPGPLGEGQPLLLDLAFDGLRLQRLLRGRDVKLDGLGARLAGKLSYRCDLSEPLAGQGWLEVHLTRPPDDVPLPITADAVLAISRGVLTSGGGVMLYSGPDAVTVDRLTVDLEKLVGGLDFRLATDNVGRWTEVLAERDPKTGAPEPSFLPLAGTGTVSGHVDFQGEQYQVDLRLDLLDVLLAPQAEAAALELATVSGSLAVTPRGIAPMRLEATREEGILLVAGAVPFEVPGEGIEAAPRPLELTLDAVSWPAAELIAMAGLELPIAGPLSGHLTLTGVTEDLSGQGRLTVEPALLAGIEADSAVTELRFDSRQLVITGAQVDTAAGRLTGSGTLGLEGEQPLDFALQTTALDLRQPPLLDALSDQVEGTLTASATIAGTLEAPQMQLSGQLQGLALAGRTIGGGSVSGTWDGARIEATAAIADLLDLSGGGAFDGSRAELSFDVAGTEVGALVRMALGETADGLEGDFAGTLTVAGPLAEPEVELRLDPLRLAYRGYRLRTIEPAVARLDGSVLRIESLYLGNAAAAGVAADDGSVVAGDAGGAGLSSGIGELFLRGAIGFDDQSLDLQLQAEMPAEWLQLVLPDARVRGVLSALGEVDGSFDEPQLDGQAELANGRVILAGFPHSLDDLTAVALIYPDRIKLDHLDATLAGGPLQAEGTLFTSGLEITDYRFQARAQHFRMRYPEGWLLSGDALLTIEPDDGGRLLQGSVELTRAEYLRDVEVGAFQLLQGLVRRQRLEAGSTDETLSQTRLNVLLTIPGGIRIQNNVADLRGSADLIVRGDLARPVVLGTVEVKPGGELVYADTRYEVDQGLMTFSSSTRINPQIDMIATTEVRDYDVTLTLSGSLDRLQANLASDPPLPDLEVLSLITTGETLSEGGLGFGGGPENAGGRSGDVARGILVGQAASVVGSRVKKLFGFDTFRIDPLSAETDSSSSARVTFGKQLTKDLFVTYSNDPSSNRDNIVKVEWQALPGLVIEVTAIDQLTFNRSDNGALAVDFRWQKKF